MARQTVWVLLALTVAFGSRGVAVAADEMPVSLPFVFSDRQGSSWDVQFDGSIGDGGNDLYDGGGRLFVNGNAQYHSQGLPVTRDPSRQELNFPPMAIGGLNVSRRVACLYGASAIRFTEVLENPTASPIKVQLRCYFNMGGSVQQAVPLVDAKRGRDPVGYAIGDQNNAVAMVGASRRASKVRPRFNYRANDDNVDIFYDDVEVPPRQTVAVVHFQIRRRTAGEAAETWEELKEADLFKDMPREMRKRVVNFPTGDTLAGDLEILRGDVVDVVELRGGDAYRGTIKVDRYRLQTLYGPVTLPAERVVAMLNVGVFRPSPLLVTREGEVFGGRLDVDSITMQMGSGPTTHIPLGQISRMGYRRQAGEPEEWNFEQRTAAYLRDGQRLCVRRPTADFNLATPSGPIRLNPAVISSIVFQGEETNVPEVRLTDGSRISALLGASVFEMTLTGLGPDQPVRLPAAALVRFGFSPDVEAPPLSPVFTLTNGDTLVGTVGGTLSLETPFDTIHVEGSQIKRIGHTSGGGDHDVQIRLWDDATLSGRLVESHVTAVLRCGVSLRVPIALVAKYEQPQPLPSEPVIAEIGRIVRELDSDRWREREAAQARLLAIGPPAIEVLRGLRGRASAEVSQRIDVIVSRLGERLERENGAAGASSSSAAAPADGGAIIDVLR